MGVPEEADTKWYSGWKKKEGKNKVNGSDVIVVSHEVEDEEEEDVFNNALLEDESGDEDRADTGMGEFGDIWGIKNNWKCWINSGKYKIFFLTKKKTV